MSVRREAGKRRKSPASIFGLGGFLNFDTKKVMDTMKKVGFVCIGYLGGREIKRMVFKAGDEKGFKKFLGEIAEVVTGVILATRNNEPMRYIGIGLFNYFFIAVRYRIGKCGQIGHKPDLFSPTNSLKWKK